MYQKFTASLENSNLYRHIKSILLDVRFNCNHIMAQKFLLLFCNVMSSQLVHELFFYLFAIKNIIILHVFYYQCAYDARTLTKNATGKVHRRKERDILVQRSGARQDLLNCN